MWLVLQRVYRYPLCWLWLLEQLGLFDKACYSFFGYYKCTSSVLKQKRCYQSHNLWSSVKEGILKFACITISVVRRIRNKSSPTITSNEMSKATRLFLLWCKLNDISHQSVRCGNWAADNSDVQLSEVYSRKVIRCLGLPSCCLNLLFIRCMHMHRSPSLHRARPR